MSYVVDLRSETVTKPTAAMKHAMVTCELGDDLFGEDPTVNALEARLAALLGKQASLLVPSGTMANLIAIMVHCNKRGSEAMVGNLSHIYKYEVGGASHVAGVLLSTLQNKPDGTFDIEELEQRVRGSIIQEPITTMVSIENTHNFCGGKVLPLEFIEAVSEVCKKYSLALHMDGARVFNAAEYLRVAPNRVVQHCDSVTVCFSKGLSAPVGAALVGTQKTIEQARRIRKMLGGGMAQAGVLAGAALVALDEVVPQLHLDHKRASTLAQCIREMNLNTFSVDVENLHTNIVMVRIASYSYITASLVVRRLQQIRLAETEGGCKTENEEGVIVKALEFDPKTVRLTLHQEITDKDLWLAIMKIKYVFKELYADRLESDLSWFNR